LLEDSPEDEEASLPEEDEEETFDRGLTLTSFFSVIFLLLSAIVDGLTSLSDSDDSSFCCET
jgi:hypothetical protein